MKIAYFDCFSGISGDMCLGALVSAGVPLKELEKGLNRLPVKGYTITQSKVMRAGIRATKVDVLVKRASGRKATWNYIKGLLEGSKLNPEIKKASLRIFKGVFNAEARVHGAPAGKIHLHEIGALDSIIDIVGTVIGLNALGVKKVFCSPVNVGSGTIAARHGRLPVPSPAAAELLRGARVYSDDTPFELATPTGAAILTGLDASFGGIPELNVESVGLGAGTRDVEGRPNVLRLFIGEASAIAKRDVIDERISQRDVIVLETDIDDMNPQIYEYVIERLYEAGALDVYLTQLIMKKGRPGVKLTVLCREDGRRKLADIIFRETTTLGVRYWRAGRITLGRTIRTAGTPLGKIRFKEAELGDKTARSVPECEDLRQAAKKHNLPLIEVMRRIRPQLKKTSGRKPYIC